MEKKDSVSKTALDSIFSRLISDQNKLIPGSAASGEEMFAEIRTWVSTGSMIFDTIISNRDKGGWPAGRTVELYGEESIGKSTLVYAGMAGVQKQGGIAIYYDVEQAASKEMMKACGINLSQLISSNLTEIEDIFKTLEGTLTTIISSKELRDKPVFICMDSYAQMSTDAETQAGYEFNMNVSTKKAIQMGKALRKITPFLNKANACLVVINQTRENVGVTFGDPTITPGGKALKFAASLRVQLLGKTPVKMMDPNLEREYLNQLKEWEEACTIWREGGGTKTMGPKPQKPPKPVGDEIIVGYDVVARTVKNKVGPPKREAEFRIMFLQGVIEEYAWLDYAIKFNLVENINSYTYKLTDPKFSSTKEFVRDKWVEILADAEVYDYIHDNVKKGLIRKTSEITTTNDEEEEEISILTPES